jgi:hypothetical protein
VSPLLWGALALHPALDAGDRAWGRGDRAAARIFWEEAADADPASAAMAEVRLLQVSGSLGILVHGPRADAALQACPPADPACALAEADYRIFVARLGLPIDADALPGLLADAAIGLPSEALARQVHLGWASEAALRDLPAHDGFGEAVLAHGGRFPEGPGTWVLGLGPVAATGLGAGLSLSLVHPDLGLVGNSLQVSAFASHTGVASWGGILDVQGRPGLHLEGRAARLPIGGSTRKKADQAELIVGPRWKMGPGLLWIGPGLRADQGRGLSLGAAGAWSQALSPSLQLRLPAEAFAGGAPVLRSGADLRALRGPWALRGLAEGALTAPRTPPTRLPGAGGGLLLRSAPYARWRGPALAGGVVERRGRGEGRVGAVIFAEGAWIDGLHGGLGGGLRLRLPPQPTNTLRLDLAWGDGGIGLSAGIGEAF